MKENTFYSMRQFGKTKKLVDIVYVMAMIEAGKTMKLYDELEKDKAIKNERNKIKK